MRFAGAEDFHNGHRQGGNHSRARGGWPTFCRPDRVWKSCGRLTQGVARGLAWPWTIIFRAFRVLGIPVRGPRVARAEQPWAEGFSSRWDEWFTRLARDQPAWLAASHESSSVGSSWAAAFSAPQTARAVLQSRRDCLLQPRVDRVAGYPGFRFRSLSQP